MLYGDFRKSARIASSLLGLSFFLALGSLFVCFFSLSIPSVSVPQRTKEKEITSFALPIPSFEETIGVSLPNIRGDLGFCFEKSRPDVKEVFSSLCVVLKKTGKTKRVELPCRLYLEYGKTLQFASELSSFWVDLDWALSGADQIGVHVFLIDPSQVVIEVDFFLISPDEPAIRSPHELKEDSPLRLLAETPLIGPDLWREKYSSEGNFIHHCAQRMLRGSLWIALQENTLLCWKEGVWMPIDSIEEANSLPLARVVSVGPKNVLFEGWDLEEYVRFSVFSSPPAPFKTRSDELLSAVRVRSEKQLSCMLEKQCLILRLGDWVLKEDSRWRVLRKEMEKARYLKGELVGELFVLDRIETAGGQKIVQGNLFNLGRSQVVPIEVAVPSQGKMRERGKCK